MRTQVDDLKKDLRFYESCLRALSLSGLSRKTSEAFKAYDDKAMKIRSTLNNIQ